jgi:hypothetical protein
MLILIHIISAFVDLLVLFDTLIAIVKVIHGLNIILFFQKYCNNYLKTVIKCPNYIDIHTMIIIYQFVSCLLLQFYVLT